MADDDDTVDIEETAPTIDGIEEAGSEPAPAPGEPTVAAAEATEGGSEASEPVP